MRRREVLRAAGVGVVLALVRVGNANATPEDMALALKRAFGSRPIQEGRVHLDLPKLAENGNVVPVTVTVESPMTAKDHVQAIHLFSEKNPLPDIVEFRLGPHNGKARVSTRIRLAESQRVIAVAVMSDGSLWSASAEVAVTITGCG
ncbi:MAG: SoxY-related AACIE arm protein [Betaproteobacteria bacterium]|nr:SoxY-related AACIE arm protein [Betaproteobacteria bacterium]